MKAGFKRSASRAVLSGLFAAGIIATLGATAQAETYKFYANDLPAYSGPFSGAGTVYDKIENGPIGERATDCPVADPGCVTPLNNDFIASSMTFTGTDGTLTATASPNTNVVWDDLSPGFGGLGVGPGTSDTDQIAGSEVLTLSFLNNVTLLGVATLFDPSHTDFGAGFPNGNSITNTNEFLLSVNGGTFLSVTFLLANTYPSLLNGGLGLVGKTFSFMQKASNPTFYVSAILTGPAQTTVVPIPAALPLLLGGLGVLTLMRRRKRN